MTSDTGRRLHERARDAVRDAVRAEVVDRALRLFDERGFEQTTVQDISEAAGISPRSFFRYFAVKEDVVIGDMTAYGLVVRDALAACPAGEPIWSALRAAFTPMIEVSTGDPERNLRLMRVLLSAPTLRARNLEKHIAWANLMAPVIAERLDGPAGSRDFRAQTLAHAALACLDVALAEWTNSGGTIDFTDLLDDGFATLGPAS
ncbi:TetR family transcriptional regulator [Actinoplanes sp. NPDC051494]|uniref:acyl-CoA-like ligand-binding transcription factor n=1 Tax=Actinoplanes sp. NPDC051494 TaxID=3363907 RepID=UPI0037B5AC2E